MQPIRWPSYLPYPTPVRRMRGPVPNRQSVDWPQSQFAPLYLPPGSPSFQPFRYPDGDATQRVSYYRLPAEGFPQDGPGGDIAQLPTGDFMPIFARANEGEAAVAVDASLPSPVLVDADLLAAGAGSDSDLSPDTVTAAVVASDAPFEAFAPEYLAILRPARQKRLQRLDQLLTRLSVAQRGPALERAYQQLMKVHEKIEDLLQKKFERRARARGALAKSKLISQRVRAAQIGTRIRTTEGKDKGGLSEVDRVQAAYDNKRINKAQYDRLMALAQRA